MWITQPLEICNAAGERTGRWRLTATSDEDGGGPHGDPSHDHATAEEACDCERCDEYVSGITGFMSHRRRQELLDAQERKEYDRLREKFAGPELKALSDRARELCYQIERSGASPDLTKASDMANELHTQIKRLQPDPSA